MIALEERIANKSAIVGIMGLGYVGLPLARAFIDAGYRVIGFDVDQSKVDQLKAGKSYIGHLDSKWISGCVQNKKLDPTADMKRLNEPDAILICVPTPLTESRDPDLSYVESTARLIAERLRPGQLIVLESTTYPGTTRDVVLPILAKSGLNCGKDYLSCVQPRARGPRQSRLLGRQNPQSNRRLRLDQPATRAKTLRQRREPSYSRLFLRSG